MRCVTPKTATSSRPTAGAAAAFFCALLLAAAAQAADDEVRPGTYRVVLQSPGGDLPFAFELERAADGWVGHLINGRERVRVDEITVNGARIDIKMPGYENHLTAVATNDRWSGELVLDKLGGKDQHIPVTAQRSQTFRFFPGGKGPAADVEGRWSVTFTDDGGKTEAGVAELSQSRGTVTGTVLTDTGDHRYLAGQVRDHELYLSTFDGAHVFLYKAQLGPDGSLAGDFWSGTAFHERWTAKRDPRAALPDAYSLTRMRDGGKAFEFAFPDLSGRVVKSTDPKFRDKVVIIALAGSWCPNCHDEAAFLEPLYRDYQARGLEIVALMFEHSGDFARAAEATERFRKQYGIEYSTLIAGVSDKDEAAKKLPMLDRVHAFPTMIVVDRKGRVQMIHTGYSGPATGAHYTDFVAEFKHNLDRLLAES